MLDAEFVAQRSSAGRMRWRGTPDRREHAALGETNEGNGRAGVGRDCGDDRLADHRWATRWLIAIPACPRTERRGGHIEVPSCFGR